MQSTRNTQNQNNQNSSNNKDYYKILVLGDSGVGKTALIQRFVNEKFNSQFKSTIGVDFHHKPVLLEGKLAQAGQLAGLKTGVGNEVVMQIWDTAGQERFQSLGYGYYRGADCCALVFDLNDPDSFERVAHWRDIFLNYSDPVDPYTFPFILIGNKSDLPQKKVQHIKAQQWCKITASQAMEALDSIKDTQLKTNLGDKADKSQVSFVNRLKRQNEIGGGSGGSFSKTEASKSSDTNNFMYTIPYFEVSARTGDKVEESFHEMLRQAMLYDARNEKRVKRKKLMLYDQADNQMFDDQGLYLRKINYKNKDKTNGGCSCYYN
eukprot:403352763